MPDLESLISDFSSYLEEKGKQKNTIRAYKTDIIKALPNENGHNSDINYILEKLDRSLNKDAPIKTKNRKKVSVNTFNKFLKTKGFIEKPRYYSMQALEENLVFITEEEYNRLISSIPKNVIKGAMARAVFSLAYNTGLKASELSRIKYKDFNIKEGIIESLTVEKENNGNKKVKSVQISDNTSKELKNYEDRVKSMGIDLLSENQLYFKLVNREISSEKFLRQAFNYWLNRSDIDRKLSFYSLRFGYAKKLVDTNTPIDEFNEKMGVSFYHGLKIYIKLSNNKNTQL